MAEAQVREYQVQEKTLVQQLEREPEKVPPAYSRERV